MAEDRNRGQPIRTQQSDESHYQASPAEENDSSRGPPYQQRPEAPMAAGTVTLPSMQESQGGYGPPGGRGWDPRSSGGYGQSPSSMNGYPPPSSNSSQPPGNMSYSPSGGSAGYSSQPSAQQPYLPPVQPPPSDPRAPPYYQQQGQAPYRNYNYAYQPERGPPGAYPPDYGRGGPPMMQPMQQSAPRQRTSIACKYCRRRKIRCSGYQNSPAGKCTNCIKMNQECIFQPVSASTSTAFVPVSALSNGVPPGTPLYGAYGEPLMAGQNAHGGPGGGHYPAGTPQYEQPLPSPTGSYGSFSDDRGDPARRRQRPPEEDHGMRLPPPSMFPDDGRRRSPSSSSPNHLRPFQTLPPQPTPQPGFENRTPPPRGSPSGAPASGASASSVMSLGNIMDGPSSSNVDSDMLNRLNRRK